MEELEEETLEKRAKWFCKTGKMSTETRGDDGGVCGLDKGRRGKWRLFQQQMQNRLRRSSNTMLALNVHTAEALYYFQHDD